MLPPQLKNVLLTSSSLYSRGPTVLLGLGSKKPWFSKQPAQSELNPAGKRFAVQQVLNPLFLGEVLFRMNFDMLHQKSILASEKSLVSLSLRNIAAHGAAMTWVVVDQTSAWQEDQAEHCYSVTYTLLVLQLFFGAEQQLSACKTAWNHVISVLFLVKLRAIFILHVEVFF